jgi:hypothetical protein
LRKSILFLTLRILRLQREIVMSKMTFCELEELGPWGPGLVSTLPTISMNVNRKRRNTAFTFGFKLWRQRSAVKRNEQCRLVKNISLYE